MTTRQIGEVYSPDHARYDEGARYAYSGGAHELVLFWGGPTPAEVDGFRVQPMDVALFTHGPAAFLLYKIKDVCEWSDVAFNIHLIPEAQRELPDEASGDRARFKMILVDAEDGVIRATQAIKHTMRDQADAAFNRFIYEAAVQEVYGRYADSDALVKVAEVVEPALG